MERWVAKVLSVIGVFIIPFGCTLLPARVAAIFERHGQKGKKLLSCLMCFGGGVFFATYMLHMGPEVRDILDVALIKPYNIKYPLTELIMAMGFFIVMFMEKIVLHIDATKKKSKQARQKAACHQFNKQNGVAVGTKFDASNPSMPISLPNTPKKDQANGTSTENCPLRGTGECCEDPVEMKINAIDEEDIGMIPGAGDAHPVHTHNHEAMLLKDSHGTRTVVLLLALSLHRIFEGMSVGLQHTTENVRNLFFAVMCHEAVIGFSLGLEFVKYKWPLKKMILACLFCSLIMPLGTVIGILATEIGSTDAFAFDLANGILQAIATGTFIYVTFFEILQEEMDPHETGLAKSFAVLVGFMVMAALCAVPEEDDMLDLSSNHLKNLTDITTPAF